MFWIPVVAYVVSTSSRPGLYMFPVIVHVMVRSCQPVPKSVQMLNVVGVSVCHVPAKGPP